MDLIRFTDSAAWTREGATTCNGAAFALVIV